MSDDDYIDKIELWRSIREKNLAAPHGWLSTAGLFWLQPGENRMGSDPSNPVSFLQGSVPAFAGSLFLESGEIILACSPGVEIKVGERIISEERLSITDGSSEEISLNDIKLFVIQRGDRMGVRIFNPSNPTRAVFKGLDWFPIQESYCIRAQYSPLDEPKKFDVINVLGDMEQMLIPGIVVFLLDQQSIMLSPFLLDDGGLWIMFRDSTNGGLTYSPGRYLKTESPKDGYVTLDFNTAYNPPCAYTDFATCPLPPVMNRLNIPILAGEMRFH